MNTSIIKIPLLIWALLFSFFSAKAAHIVGGEMTYRCIGVDPSNSDNMLYEFTMTVYRDCDGEGADFDSAPGAFTGRASVYLGTTFVEDDDINPVRLDAPVESEIDPAENNPCIQVPVGVCLEKGVYTFTRSLRIENESYRVVYQRCCRNGTIENIWTPGEVGATYTVEITPNAQNFCNSSPVFNSFPPAVICVNESIDFDHMATDIDGDQLIYEFCAPLRGGSQNSVAPQPDAPPPYEGVEFILPNFSANTPLGGNPLVVIDPLTGFITGNPVFESQYVVGICVTEFRNGVPLSTVQRDFQFNVTYCEPLVNANIQNGNVSAEGNYVLTSCVDSTITIINESTDENFIDSYLWEFDFENGQVPLSFNERDVTLTFPGPGRYLGTMTLNPNSNECSDQAIIDITITSPINPDFSFDYDTCVAGPVEFMETTLERDWPIVEYLWDFGDGNTSTEKDPIHQYLTPGLKNVTLTVTDNIGCFESVTQTVNWYPVPPLIIIDPSTAEGCPPEEIEFINLSTPIDTTYDIVWDFGDGGFANALSPTHTYMVPDSYSVSVEITSPIGCFTSEYFRDLIFIDSLPEASFVFDPPNGTSNFEPDVTFEDQSFKAAAWEWDFGNADRSIRQNPSYTFPDTGRQEVQLFIQSFYGCEDSISLMVDVEPKVTFFMPNAFTPNNDGLNEFFMPGGFFRGIRDYNMTIWDRWGGLLFETKDINIGWDGRGRTGKMSPSGVYVYHITFTAPRGEPMEYKGFATIVR